MNNQFVTAHESSSAAERLAREHLNITAGGNFQAVEGNVTPDYFNHRSADEPMETRQRGPEGLKATMRWLHRAFADMRFEFHEVLVDGDRVVARVTLHARQHGPFVVHDSPDGGPPTHFPPTVVLSLPGRLTGSGLPTAPSPSTTRFAMTWEWPSSWDGFRPNLCLSFACCSPGNANVVQSDVTPALYRRPNGTIPNKTLPRLFPHFRCFIDAD